MLVCHRCTSVTLEFKLNLTVRRCFLRMYIMKPHILDATPRNVRIPSKHCRVFSMSMSRQSPLNSPLQLARSSQSRRDNYLRNLLRRCGCRRWVERPSKRVSTSLCTLVAQLISNKVHFHFINVRRTWTCPKDRCYTPTAAPWTLARSSLTS